MPQTFLATARIMRPLHARPKNSIPRPEIKHAHPSPVPRRTPSGLAPITAPIASPPSGNSLSRRCVSRGPATDVRIAACRAALSSNDSAAFRQRPASGAPVVWESAWTLISRSRTSRNTGAEPSAVPLGEAWSPRRSPTSAPSPECSAAEARSESTQRGCVGSRDRQWECRSAQACDCERPDWSSAAYWRRKPLASSRRLSAVERCREPLLFQGRCSHPRT